jgi:Predicted xylanase/chitin deacetylase
MDHLHKESPRIQLFRLTTLIVALAVLFASASAKTPVYAGTTPSVSLTASGDTFHSGAPLTLTAELSSPASDDLSVAVEGGSDGLTIAIPKGEKSGTLSLTTGKYKKIVTETYSVAPGTGYTAGNPSSVEVTVLPVPELEFNAQYYTALPGKDLTVKMKCKNASLLTIPVEATLRLPSGEVLERFEFSSQNNSARYQFTLPEEIEPPYYLYLYNEASKEIARQIPLKVENEERKRGIYSVDTEEKKIAISFDCGFANKYTEYILDTLDEYNIKCTFFVTGVFVSDYSDMLKEIHDRGHEIGNHTMNHLSLVKITEEDVYNEVKRVNDKVYKKLGVRPTVMRPPYGSTTPNVNNLVRMAGCEVVLWSHDSVDWDPKRSTDEIIKRATKNIHNGSIVLFHNSAPKTKKTLRVILDKYKEMGYEIVPVSELLYHSHYTIDSNGVQHLKPDYQQITPSELMNGYSPRINVSGASGKGEEPVSLALDAVYSDEKLTVSKNDIAKLQSDSSLINVSYDCGDSVAAPVRKGDRIGTATFSYGQDVVFTAEVTAASDIEARQPSEDDVTQSDIPGGIEKWHPLIYVIGGLIVTGIAGLSVLLLRKKRKG